MPEIPYGEDEDPGIDLEIGLQMLRQAERHFNLGQLQDADTLLGLVQGTLEYLEEQQSLGELGPRSSRETTSLRRLYNKVNSRLSPQRKYADTHNLPPSDFLELFRSNLNNTMVPEAIANGLRRIRVVAIDNGDRARQVMIDLHDMPVLPPSGWRPNGGWGFEYWPADFAASFDPASDDVRSIVAGRLEDRPPPSHIRIEGALVWVDEERCYVGFSAGPWHPGAYPDEVFPLPLPSRPTP